MSILVVGSFVMDCVTKTKRAPSAGETILGESFKTFPGGKGANQAISAKRLGADVYMSGMLGNDAYADVFVQALKHDSVDIENVFFTDNSTGIGNIVLEENGQNRIIVIPGANHNYEVEHVKQLENVIKKADIIVCQLELKYEVVQALAALCEKHQKTFILNPAPARFLDENVLKTVSYLTPNETELEILTNLKIKSLNDVKAASKTLLNKGVKNIIVTLGDAGALFINNELEIYHKGYKVKAIDTVGAGDSFTGALAYGLDNNYDIESIMELANAVGALTVQKQGAIPSLPTINEVENFLKSK